MKNFLKKFLRLVTKSDQPSKIIELPALEKEIDMSKIMDLDEQKGVCSEMTVILKSEEDRLKTRFLVAHTVTDFLEANKEIRADVGEYVGYHFGAMGHNMMMVESAIKSLVKFQDGHFDEIEPPARGMFVSVWYNIALANIELLEASVGSLEALESDLIQRAMDDNSEETFLKRGVIH